ncbi:hypothetical protein A2U01_0066910, partial [Trifolium medium]|nr:hypothetical protein [Trifolium medium]
MMKGKVLVPMESGGWGSEASVTAAGVVSGWCDGS